MAVIRNRGARTVVNALTGTDPVPLSRVLADPVLPAGMSTVPSGLDPDTATIGGYAHPARYLTAPGLAGSPAHGQSAPQPKDVQAYQEASIDLTMEGGTTSGVVYPLAVCELATRFHFRNVGGASAGAIAAALTAAAEIGRSRQLAAALESTPTVPEPTPTVPEPVEGQSTTPQPFTQGFVGLAQLTRWLTQADGPQTAVDEFRLAQLFRPGGRTKGIFRVLIAIMRARLWTLPLLAVSAFGWLTRAASLALVLLMIMATGWFTTRLNGPDRSIGSVVLQGFQGFGAFLLLVVGAILLGPLWVAIGRQVSTERRPSAGWLQRLRTITAPPPRERRSWIALLIGAVMLGVVVAYGVVDHRGLIAAVLVGFTGVFGFLLIVGLAALRWVGKVGHLRYGIVPGTTAPSRRNLLDLLARTPPATVQESLVPWLERSLRELAGNGAEVLRFGHLWNGLADWDPTAPQDDAGWLQRWRETDHRVVNLELMTTDLTRRRPYRFPLAPPTSTAHAPAGGMITAIDQPASGLEGVDFAPEEQLWFAPEDFGAGDERIFPDAVIKVLTEGMPLTVLDESGVRQTLYPVPPPWRLPVIFAVRISMSLPGLFAAVPLYRLVAPEPVTDDLGRQVLDDGVPLPPSGPPVATRCWFADGGITSNFPVHFFDASLPRWPTVSLNLGTHPAGNPIQDVWLPQDWDSHPGSGQPVTTSGLSWFGAIFGTALSWRDTMQSAMPSNRSRIAQVRTAVGEGGINLFMSRETIASMALRGALAGYRLRERFSDTGSWARFRWLRLRVALSNTEKLRRSTAARRPGYVDELAGPDWLTQLAGLPSWPPTIDWYDSGPTFWPSANSLLTGFDTAYQPPPDDPLTTNLPEPQPLLRLVPPE